MERRDYQIKSELKRFNFGETKVVVRLNEHTAWEKGGKICEYGKKGEIDDNKYW